MVNIPERAIYALPLILITLSSVLFLYYYQDKSALPTFNGPYTDNENTSSGVSAGNFNLTLNITQTNFYKGDNIDFTASLVVESSIAYFDNLTISVIEPSDDISANQSILIKQSFQPGTYTLNLTLTPGFNIDGLVALVDKTYNLTAYYVYYNQGLQDHVLVKPYSHQLIGAKRAAYEQLKDRDWNILQENNVIAERSGSTLNVTSLPGNSDFSVQITAQTTGYTRLNYDIFGLDTSSLNLTIGSYQIILTNQSNFGYIGIGNLQGLYNISIGGNLVGNENISISLEMITQYLPIYAVIANDNWGPTKTNSDNFESPSAYIKVVSKRFEQTMNISIIPIAYFDLVLSSLVNSLTTLGSTANIEAGNAFNLLGGSWKEIAGTSPLNNGADVMLVFTNRTMDHLGTVHRVDDNNNVNVALIAQGSTNLNAGNQYEGVDVDLRISPIWCDNLIQHEFSHIFKAPDRWTDTDPTSVMTKSKLDFAYGDILHNEFWLFLTNWLEQDIQTMMLHTYYFR